MLAVVKGALDMDWTNGSGVINAAIENLIDGTVPCIAGKVVLVIGNYYVHMYAHLFILLD